MGPVEYELLEALWSHFGTPNVGIGEEEDLLGSVTFQAGQPGLTAVNGHVVLIGSKGLSYPAIIRNVLSLRDDAIDLNQLKGYGT